MNRVLVPVASLVSSLGLCPRLLFDLLGCIQMGCMTAICTITTGLCREYWTTNAGQCAFIAMFSVVGAFQGYLLTMTYRYIGDAATLTHQQRRSASSLLGFLSVVVLNPVAIAVGSLVSSGTIS